MMSNCAYILHALENYHTPYQPVMPLVEWQPLPDKSEYDFANEIKRMNDAIFKALGIPPDVFKGLTNK